MIHYFQLWFLIDKQLLGKKNKDLNFFVFICAVGQRGEICA